MFGAEFLIGKLRDAAAQKLSEANGILSAPMEAETPPIIMATKPRAKSNRIATMETVDILTAIMPADQWNEIERRVTG